jgi:hypothetical protein
MILIEIRAKDFILTNAIRLHIERRLDPGEFLVS